VSSFAGVVRRRSSFHPLFRRASTPIRSS